MGAPEKRATLTTPDTAIPSASMPGSPNVSSILVLLLSSYSYDQIGRLCRFVYYLYQRILSLFVIAVIYESIWSVTVVTVFYNKQGA